MSYKLEKAVVTEKDAIAKGDFFFGILFGIILTLSSVFIYNLVEPMFYPREVVCQNGKAFVATEWGSSVYLKTTDECLDTRITEGGK